MSDNNLFNIKEKLDILVKASFGVPSTSDKKEWSDEFVERFNKGVKGSDILIEEIPENPDFTVVRQASDLGLQDSDFVGYSFDNSSIANCSIVDDTTGVVRRIQGLKLDRCDGIGTNNYSWTKKNASGNNVLFDSLQFNYKMNTDINGNVNKPYQYYLFTERSGDSTIPEGNSGGNWVYDVNTGILLFADVENLNNGEDKFKIGDSNKPVITVFVYIGKKGIANLEISDISGASTNTSNLSTRIDTNKSNIETLESQFTTLDSTVSDLSTNKIYISTWEVIVANDNTYRFTGPGNLDGSTQYPDIYLVRGQQYKFSVNVSGHPFRIQTQTGTSGNVYGTGVTGNGNENGDITFDVPMEAPSRLYYQCARHNNMNGNIFIGDKIYDLSQNLSTFETNTANNFTTVNNRVSNLDVSLNNLNINLRSHIDNVVSGLDIKDSVKYASSVNIGISGFDTTNGQIDGNTLNEGDRILLVGQTDKTQNGIYKRSGTELVRTDDFDSTENVSGGAFCFVEGGDTNSGKGFVLTNTGAITIGTTLLDFTQFSDTGLADGVVTTAKLDTNAVTSAKLASNAVLTTNIVDGNVTTVKIEDGAVTAAKLAETYIKQGTSSQRNIAVDGNLIPSSNQTYSLGSAGNAWGDIYVSNNTIYFDQGANEDEIAIGISKTDLGNDEEYSLNLKIKGRNDNNFKNIKLGKGKINKNNRQATDDAFVGKFTELEDSNIHSLTGISGNFIIVSDDKINAVTPSDVRTRISVKSNDQFDASFSQVNTRIDNINTSLTVKQVSSNTSANNQTHADISTISFDNDSGFNVTNTSTTGEVKISLGSHWKTIQIDGTDKLTPSGEESLNLVNGQGINITGDSGTNPQSLTFSLHASIKDLTDTPGTLGSAGQVLKVNDTEDGLEFANMASGGSSTFTDLTDTPSAIGSAGQVLKVNSTGNLVFEDLPSGGSSTFTDLTDTPSDFSNQGGKFLKVNSAADALIFADAPSGSGNGSSTFLGLTDTPVNFTNQGGKFLKVNNSGTQLIFTDPPSGGSGGSGGDGIKVVPSSASNTLEEPVNYPTANTGSGKEGEIIYDASKNKFYGATNSKEDGQTGGTVAFRPLGYSFFAENMEGQPPAPAQDSFFFFLTSKTIVIKWTNPTQFETGLTGPKGTTSMPLDNLSPIVTAPNSTTGGQIWFPIVNRIMIQIKNLDDNTYETWGTRTSPISNSIIVNGRVICEKANIIPPASNTVSNSSYYFGPRYNYGSYSGVQIRGSNDRVYKLKDFANSIILYKNKSIPDNLEGTDTNQSNLVDKRIYSAKQGTDTANEEYTLPDSENGFEISIWLENQYDSNNMTENDFNIVKLTRMNRIMDENGNEVTSSSSNGLKNQIGQPIRFLTVDPPTKIRVADYGSTDGFHVKLKRIPNTTVHYLECIVPRDAVNPTDTTKKNEDNIKVESTQSAGQENEVYFKGYFIEYQTIEADTNATKSLSQLATEFNNNGTSWTFVNFESFSSNSISFNHERANDTDSNKTMATDTEAELETVIYPSGTNNDDDRGFISAAPYSGGFSTKTEDITWSVSKAFTLNQGDNKFYRFRIRGLNSGNKNVGPVSEKYFYFRFNEPDQITWKTPNPKFKANQLTWDITLNWNSITNSSKEDTDNKSYTVSDLAIMEYKLQRRDSDSDSESWQTISYWKNTSINSQLETHNYQIWPTTSQTIDNNYESNSYGNNNSWSTATNSNKAEWVYYDSGGTRYYTQEARLLGSDSNSPYKTRNPTYYFRIQARNYLFGKRVDTANSDALETSIKQWFVEGTIDSTNSNKNITDSRWSSHSLTSAGLITTAHTYNTTTETGYTPLLQNNSNNNDKYEIKFYEKDSADSKSPWKNVNGNTDYDESNTRRVKYTNNASRTTTTLQPYNNIPTSDYISYQWQITGNKTTVDSTGLSIDRYEIVETYWIGQSSTVDNSTKSTQTTIIYSPDFRRGPANWHIRVYNQYISSSPSFVYKVRAFNFFNSTPSKYSPNSTVLTPTKPSPPRYLSSPAGTPQTKVNSNPTFALTDTGITILVDEPQYTGYHTNNTNTQYNTNHYQDQAISLSEFALQDIRLDSANSAPSGEITLINTHGTTSRSGSSIQGNKSQVAKFYHPNGYTQNPQTALKDLDVGKVEYSFHAKNVLKDEFSATSSCSLTIGKPNPGENFKLSPKFTWVLSTNKVKLEFFRKYDNTDILYDDSTINDSNGSTIAPISAVTNSCNFSNFVKKLVWQVQCLDNSSWTTNTNIPNAFPTDTLIDTNFTIVGDNSSSTPAYSISDIDIEDQAKEVTYTIDYRIRNQYNQNYFASNDSSDIGTNNTAPLQIKLDVPVWISTNSNNVFTSKFTYGLPTANSVTKGNKILISWKRPTHGGLYFKHQGGSLSPVSSPNIEKYKIYLKATNLIADPVTNEYYICTITQNRTSGDYNNAIDSSTPTLTIYSGGTTSPASSTGNDTQTIVIKKITGGSSPDYYSGTQTDISNFRFKPEHEYTVEKITAFNWLYDQESANMNNGIKTKYQNGINGGTTATITSLTPVQINALETVNYPPIGSNNYIATSASAATAPTVSAAGAAKAVAGPQLNTFSQYANNGSLINGAGISSTTNKKINKLAEIAGTSVSNIIINKDYAKIPNSTVGMSIRLGVKIGSGNESFTNFCTFTNSTCADKDLKYTWGTSSTETTIATISSGTSTATHVNPVDIYTGTSSEPWKTDNQTYWFASSSIQISTASTINDVTAFYGRSVVFKVYVYYHSENNLYNETFNNNSGEETYSEEAIYTLTNNPNSNYYDDGSLGVPTAISGTITYTGTQVYTVLGLPILKSDKMPSISYNFENKSTKWALHTNKKVLDVKLGSSTSSVLSTTNTVNSNHDWSDTTSVSLSSNLDIEFPDTTSKTSLVKNAQLFVKATNIVGTQASWYNGWSGDTTKFIYDPKTLALINTIASDGNIGKIHGIVSQKTGTFTPSNMICCQVPKNFNPNESGQYCNATTGVWTAGKLNVTHADSNIATAGVNRLIMFDGKFCSDAYFRSTSGFGTTYTNYHSKVQSFLEKVDENESNYTSYFNSANEDLGAMKDNYRWQIFCYGWKYTGSASGFVQAISFKLGTDHDIRYTDFYNASDPTKPADGGPPGSNVEIWTKVAGMGYEGRWNNATAANTTYQGDSGGNLDGLGQQSNQAWCNTVTKGWLTSDGANTLSGGNSTTNEINIAASKAPYSASGNDVFYIYVAIGLKNNVSRYITIPTTNNKLFNDSYTNTPG